MPYKLERERLERALDAVLGDAVVSNVSVLGFGRSVARAYLLDGTDSPVIVCPFDFAALIEAVILNQQWSETIDSAKISEIAYGSAHFPVVMLSAAVWNLVGNPRNLPGLQFSPTLEECELQDSRLTGVRAQAHCYKFEHGSGGKIKSEVRHSMSALALPNGAKGQVNIVWKTDDESVDYTVTVNLNPVGVGVGPNTWKDPIEVSAAEIWASHLTKKLGRRVSVKNVPGNNPIADVVAECGEEWTRNVQHTRLESLESAMSKKAPVQLTLSRKDILDCFESRLDKKLKKNDWEGVWLLVDAGFLLSCCPPMVKDMAERCAREDVTFDEVWIVFRVGNEVHKLK